MPDAPRNFPPFPSPSNATWNLRIACLADIPGVEILIPLSVRGLQAAHYSPAQMNAALGTVFGVDRQIIEDGTYYVAEERGQVIAAGGWSRRLSHYGASEARTAADRLLDPMTEAARIRAFFVHPDFARRGLGRAILQASEEALRRAQFRRAELVATLAGEPLYAANGYRATDRFEISMRDSQVLPVVRMVKEWPSS